jgi:hypothetical protein
MSRPAFSTEGVVLGAALVGLGTLWALSNVGRLELLPTLRTWWPLTLIVWGLLELVELRLRRSSRRP